MGLKIIVPLADYSQISGFDSDAIAYLTASGITDSNIRNSLNNFVISLKNASLWNKIGYSFPILGSTYDQVKRNLKSPTSGFLTNVGGGVIANIINKGIVLTGVGAVGGPQVELPISMSYLFGLETSGGHAMYFINDDLSASSTVVPGLGIVLGNTSSSVAADATFTVTGATLSPPIKGFSVNGSTYSLTPKFITKGSFAVKHKGTGLGVSFYGNKSLLGSTTTKTTSTTVPTARPTIGISGTFPVNNTVSYVSYGNVAMTDTEMINYQVLVSTLISEVHGIAT